MSARSGLDRLRVAAGFLACATVSLGLDAWLRFWVLPRHGAESEDGRAAFRRATALWGRTVLRVVRWAARIAVEVEGSVPEEGRYLIVANHQSSLDVPLLIATFPAQHLTFVAMRELARGLPLVSLVLRHGGSVCIGARAGEDLAALSRFASGLEARGASAVIFPSGWLERDEPDRPFHPAGAEIIRRIARLPLLPVAIAGQERAPSIGSILALAGSRVTVRIGEPVVGEGVERDPRAAWSRVEEWIYGAVREMRERDGPAAGDAGLRPATPDRAARRRGA